MGLNATNPVFGVFGKVTLKPVLSALEINQKIEILPVASLDKIRSKKRITKALICLCGCAGWCALLLLANPEDRFYLTEVKFLPYMHHVLILCCQNMYRDHSEDQSLV